MSATKTLKSLAQAFAGLSQAATRRKIYSLRAARAGRPEVAHFLRAMSASEAVQARRLFNNLIGWIDRSDEFLESIFEKEVQTILENYTELLGHAAAEKPALLPAVKQLRAAETRLRSFYSPGSKTVKVSEDAAYFICKFCGYLATDSAPEKCPVCTAAKDAFNEIY